MGYKELMKEVRGIVEGERKPKVWHQTAIGREGLMKLVKMGALTKDEVFPVPKFVKDTPFDEKLWGEAVEQVWGKQEMWTNAPTNIRGMELGPNYSLVVRTWKKLVADEYGFEPTRTKEQSLVQNVKDEVSRAAKLMAAAAAKARKKVSEEEWKAEWMGDELDEEEWPHVDDELLSDWMFDEALRSEDEGEMEEALTPTQREKLPDSAFVFPDRRAWPIQSEKQARIAINFIQRRRGKPKDWPVVCSEIGKKYPDLKGACQAAMK